MIVVLDLLYILPHTRQFKVHQLNKEYERIVSKQRQKEESRNIDDAKV